MSTKNTCDASNENEQKILTRAAIPETVDWTPYCNEIQNQGTCGSCWSFSSVAAIETRFHIKNNITDPKNKVKLSEQQMIDCDTAYGSLGCSGGLAVQVFAAVKDKGITYSQNYPYVTKQNSCKTNNTNLNYVTDYKFLVSVRGDETALKLSVSMGPVSVGIDSSQESFRYFKTGVYYDPDCRSDLEYLDHEVLVVGYGTTADGNYYWLIRNSYGTTWGDSGYFKLARNFGNHCGVAGDTSYPIV